MFSGSLIIDKSKDPQYVIEFSYINDKYNIPKGLATFHRTLPEPVVSFDAFTEYAFERYHVDDDTINSVKLQIGKTVCDYLFKKR